MNKSKKILSSVVLLVVLSIVITAFSGCKDAGKDTPSGGETTLATTQTTQEPTPAVTKKPINTEGKNYLNLITDLNFDRGVLIGNNEDVADGKVAVNFKNPESKQKPMWQLGQQYSKFDLRDVTPTKDGDTYVLENEGKIVKFRDNFFSLEIFAEKEYVLGQYEKGAGWPHLQMSQEFRRMPKMEDLDEVLLKFNLNTAYLEDNTPEGDPHLHTAVFILSILVQNRNASSPGYGDYYWLQFPLADHLTNTFTGWEAPDLSSSGTGDGIKQGTGKYMVSVSGADYYDGQFGIGKDIEIYADIYESIKNGFERAKLRGYLPDSEYSDMAIGSMHWGWEIRGSYNTVSTISDFAMNVHYKDNRSFD